MDGHVEAKVLGVPQDGLLRALRRATRPVLTHLNADTTWLLTLPYPPGTPRPDGRSQYHLLIDPWLAGFQADVAGWFSKQWHLAKSSVETIDQLEALLSESERQGSGQESDATGEPRRSFIDAVAISHEFTDHCHRGTLLEIAPTVPVFATPKAAELIRSWRHFATVVDVAAFTAGTDWRTTSVAPLPSWLGISRLVTGSDALYYHSALVICVQGVQAPPAGAEAIVYTPHGVESASVSALSAASPSLNHLALLHGLHDVSIVWSKQLNLGAVNAVKAQMILQAKYWIGTHDEVKRGAGLIAPLLRRKVLTVREALAILQAENNGAPEAVDHEREPVCLELGNGDSLLLE